MAQGLQGILDFLGSVQDYRKSVAQAEQVREILPASAWLNQEYYVGQSGMRLYPFWKDKIIDIFETNRGKYNEVIVTGRLGTGKTTFGLFLLIRRLYELSCYKRVQCLFDLMPSAVLAIVYFSLSQKLAKKSGFGQLLNLIDEIPYFKEEFLRDKKISSEMKFPENLLIYSGSTASSVTGMNLIGSLLDEANFFGTAGLGGTEGHEVDYTKVSAMYTAIVNRGQSRFRKNGRDDSLSVLISSTTTQSSLTEQRIAKAIEEGDKSHTKVVVANLWEVKPKGSYSEDRFWVFLGSEVLEPKIVTSVGDVEAGIQRSLGVQTVDEAIDRISPVEREKFKQVPEDFRSAFTKDIVYSIRDILGVSIASLGRLFNSKEVYERSVQPMDNLERPFLSDELTLATLDDSSVQSYVNPNFVPENKQVPRYFHYDQSTTTDFTGVAWAYMHHLIKEKVQVVDPDTGSVVEREVQKPVFCVEGMVSCIPPKAPKKISIRKCRDIIYHLRDHLGIQIGMGTYDQFASAEARQEFQEQGIDAEYLSVDRTDEQYLLFVTLLNEGRLIWPRNKIARKELFDLEHNRARRRVDHPRNSCLTGDTLIKLLDGTSRPIKDLVGKQFDLYGCDRMGRVLPVHAVKCWEAKRVTELYEVTLDNGEVVRCTDNHPFMLRDGSYVKAIDLKPDTSLMAFHNRFDGKYVQGYERFWDNGLQRWVYTHKMVDEFLRGSRGKNDVVHHYNMNKVDNRPENLIRMSREEHGRVHALISKFSSVPDVVRRRAKNFKKAYRDRVGLSEGSLSLSRIAHTHYEDLTDEEKLVWKRLRDSGVRVIMTESERKSYFLEKNRREVSRKASVDRAVSLNTDYWTSEEGRKRRRELAGTQLVEARKHRMGLEDEAWLERVDRSIPIISVRQAQRLYGGTVVAIQRRLESIGWDFVKCFEVVRSWSDVKLRKIGSSIGEVRRLTKVYNRKVVSVRKIVVEPTPVYDIEVPLTSNFLLDVGVFVHNSKDLMDAVVGAVWNAHEAYTATATTADAGTVLSAIDFDENEDLFPEFHNIKHDGRMQSDFTSVLAGI